LLTQLKREKQSKNWPHALGSPGNREKSPMLRFFLNNSSLELSLLSDMIQVISFLTNQRPLMLGQMAVKDAKVMQVFNEILVDYVTQNQNEIMQKLSTSKGILFSK
jgi:hypothetical protein